MYPSVCTIYGEPGTIKTSIALTWPGRIAVYNLEGGLHRAWVSDDDGANQLEKLMASGDIVERTFDIPIHSLVKRYEALEGYVKAWGSMTAQMEKDYKEFDTIVWDTGTVVWALARDCTLENIQKDGNKERKQLIQIEYGLPNRFMQELFNLPRAFKKNLVITHHEADEYAHQVDPAGKPIIDSATGQQASFVTGKKVPEGFKNTLGLSDWVVRTVLEEATLWRDSGTRSRESYTEETPVGIIQKSAYGFHLRGAKIPWPTYDKIDALAMPLAVEADPQSPANKAETPVEAST